MKKRRVQLVGAMLVILLLTLAACGGGDDGDQDTQGGSGEDSGSVEKVSLRWNYIFDGTASPFFYADSQGLYEDAGFDVRILPGRGSLIAAQTVATGRDDYAIITADAAIQVITAGGNLQITAALQRSHPAALIHKTDIEIETLQDLVDEEAVLISGAGSSYHQALFGIMAEAGIPKDSVEIQYVDFAAFAASYRTVDRAAVVGGIDSEPAAYREFDPDVQAISLTDLGLNMYGNVLVTQATRIQEDPEGVRAFTGAILEGWTTAMEDPEAAAAAMVEANPDLKGSADTPAGQESLEVALSLFESPSDPSAPIGRIVDSDFAEMVDFLSNYMGLEDPLDPEAYYTNEFVPE